MTIADEAREFAKRLHVLADDILAGRMTVARNYELYSELFNMARTLEHQKEAGRAEAMASLEIDGMRDVICALDGFMATGRRPRGAAWTRVARARTALANIRNGSAPTPEPPSEKENEGG